MQRIRIKCLPGSSFKLTGSYFKKNIKKIKKVVDIFFPLLYTNSCVTERTQNKSFGVWLSLARAPGLGPGGRRFESCHPDYMRV